MTQVVTIADEKSGTEASILVSAGFNCFSWTVPDGGERRDLLFADSSFGGGGCRPTSGGIPLMFPFAGRIGKGKYSWQGRDYTLPEGDHRGNAIHGFVFNRPWRIVEQHPNSLTGEFLAGRDADEVLELWPCDFAIRVTYSVSPGTLLSQVELSNPGENPLPFTFGWHPYFRMPLASEGSMTDTTLTVPTSTIIPLEEMLPTGKLQSLDDSLSLSDGFVIGDRAFDDPFLLDEATGDVHLVTLRDQASGRSLKQSFSPDIRYAVIYTPGDRGSICVEPQTGSTDPFRMKEAGLPAALDTIAPGESRTYEMRLEFSL